MKAEGWEGADAPRGVWGAQGEEWVEWEADEGGGLKLRDVDDGPEDGKAEVLTVGRPDEDQACLRASVVPLAGPGGSSIRLPLACACGI